MLTNDFENGSFELFIHIFNSMSDMMFIVSVDDRGEYRYLFANEAAHKFTGLTQEFYGKTMKEFLPYPIFEFIKGKYDDAINKRGPIHYVEKFSSNSLIGEMNVNDHSNKQIAYHESTITPVFGDNRKCTHVLAIVRDITEQNQKEKELKKAKKHFELVWNSTADAMYTFNKNENFVNVNPAFENLFGWKKEEIVNDTAISIIPNKEIGVLTNIIDEVKNGEKVPAHEVQRIAKDGTIIDVLASYSPIYDQDGNWEGGVAVYKDITERIHNLKELEKSEERYRLITEHSSDLIKVTDQNGVILYDSPSHFYQLGVNSEELLNKSILSLVFPEDRLEFDALIHQINLTRQPASLDFRQLNSKGEVKWFQTIGTPILDGHENVERIIFAARNITERKIYEAKLEQLASYDSLTGQPNRRNFYSRLEEEIDLAKQCGSTFSVMMLDLDQFKQINDTFGHDIGDELLKGFSERVRSCLREQDILARLGGDEFVILMPNLSEKSEALEMANRIIHSLQEKWKIGNYHFLTSSSIGITFYPPYDQDHKTLLKHADLALYRAKEEGRNNFQVYQDNL